MKRSAKRYLTEGGNDLKNYLEAISYLSNFFKNLKYFTRKLVQFLKPCNEEELSRGVVLIEFAVCMPILIILLFYINDLIKIKRMFSQTEFVAQQVANILQNISQKRENKLLTLDDFRYALCLAHLSIYPGTSQFWEGSGFGLVHHPESFITYVKGNADGSASCKWTVNAYSDQSKHISPKTMVCRSLESSHNGLLIKYQQNVAPESIHPLLKINSGEEKLIAQISQLYMTSYLNNDGYKPGSARKAYNCFLYNIKPTVGKNWYFSSMVIFSPKKGLCSDNPPSQ